MAGAGFEFIGAREVEGVARAIERRTISRDLVGSGATDPVRELERLVGEATGARFVIAMNSCTSALFAGIVAAGIGPGDEVLVPRFTFPATAAAALYSGADVRMIDSDPSLSIDPTAVAAALGPRTRAVIAVHMLGRTAQLEELSAICRRAGISLIEDAAQAVGGSWLGTSLGTFGIFGVFSLGQYKTVTCGEGGLLLTNSQDIYEAAFALHAHGWQPPPVGERAAGGLLGLNFMMDGVTAALATEQWRRLPQVLRTTRERLDILEDLLTGRGLSLAPDNCRAGNIGSAAVLRFEFPNDARKFANLLSSTPLDSERYHTPWRSPQYRARFPRFCGKLIDPGDEACVTASHLERSVALGIGLDDELLCVKRVCVLTSGLDEFKATIKNAVSRWMG